MPLGVEIERGIDKKKSMAKGRGAAQHSISWLFDHIDKEQATIWQKGKKKVLYSKDEVQGHGISLVDFEFGTDNASKKKIKYHRS